MPKKFINPAYFLIGIGVVVSILVIFSTGTLIPINESLSTGLETTIKYTDGTTSTIGQTISLASLRYGSKEIESITYNPYFVSKFPTTVKVDYSVVTIPNVYTESKTQTITITESKSYLNPITISASKLITNNDIDLQLLLTINSVKLKSEILTLKSEVKTISGDGTTITYPQQTPISTPEGKYCSPITLKDENGNSCKYLEKLLPPTPTPTPPLTPTLTPTPMATSIPTPSPTPLCIPYVTCPTPIPTDTPVITPIPTSYPTAAPTPYPTYTSYPTITPTPIPIPITYSLILVEVNGEFQKG